MADRDPNFGVQGKRGGMGGKYATKSVNLGMETLRKAGAGKAAKRDAVSISDTSRNFDEGRTVGPDGRPITGVIELEDGATAVYLDGRRVQLADARDADRGRRGKGSDRGGPDKGKGPDADGPPPPPPDGPRWDKGTVKVGPHGQENVFNGKKWVNTAAQLAKEDKEANYGAYGGPKSSRGWTGPSSDEHAPARPTSYASGGPSSYTPGGSNGGSGIEGGVRNLIATLLNPPGYPERAGRGLDRLEEGFGRGAGKLPGFLGHGIENLERIPPRLGKGIDNILGWLPGDR